MLARCASLIAARFIAARLVATLLLLPACATRTVVTEIELGSADAVGVAVPPLDPDPARWLAPPQAPPFEAHARLISPGAGISEAPEVEVRRPRSGGLTLLCRPCARAWIDVVDAEGTLRLPGPLASLERRDGSLLVPLRVVTDRDRRGDPEGDLAIERKHFADLLAIVPLAAVQRVQERTVVTRPRAWSTTGVLAGAGLLVGGAGLMNLLDDRQTRHWPGTLLLGAGLSIVTGAVIEALLPRRHERVVELEL